MKPIYIKTRKVSIYSIIFLFVMYSFYITCSSIFLSVYNMYPHIAIWWAYVIPNLMLSFVVLQFVMSMYVITDRLICYNKLLKELEEFDNIPWINAHPNKLYTVAANGNVSLCQRYKKRYVILDSIGKIHYAICDAADYLDRFFSIQMLVTCAVSFLLIIFGIYYTLISFSSDDSDVWHYFGVIMFFSSQTSSYLFQIVACVNMCTLLNDEVINK